MSISDRDLFAAFLMRDKVCGGTNDLADVSRDLFARSDAAEIEQAGRYALAAKRFAFYQAEIFRKIVNRFGLSKSPSSMRCSRASAHAAIVASGLFIS